MQKTFSIFLFIVLITSCNINRYKYKYNKTHDISQTPPPGTIKISENLFLDKTEMTNIGWLEYLFWMKRIYGENSDKYNSALPDTNVWSELNTHYSSLDTFYLRHPAYRQFPVVGVSYEQATEYSKWRSNRVMEQLLIHSKIIKVNSSNSKDSIFTIDKYFNGLYQGINPPFGIYEYPNYSLPDSTIYFKAIPIIDSVNLRNYKSCKDKYCAEDLLIDCNCLENELDSTSKYPFGIDPTVSNYCVFCKKELITHLKGNVREMTNLKGQYFGISFYDSCEKNYYECRFDSSLVNSFTGFRNVCRYRKWENN